MLEKDKEESIPSKMVDTVTITKELYNHLRRDARVLRALEAGGVDNWEWYEDSLSDCDMEASDA